MISFSAIDKTVDVLWGSSIFFINMGFLKYLNKKNECNINCNIDCNTESNNNYNKVCPYKTKCGKYNLNIGLSLGMLTGLAYIYKGYKK